MARVSCILLHRGVQLILAYNWARLGILVAGKDRGECFYAPAIFTGGAYSITAVCTYLRPVRPCPHNILGLGFV